MSRLSRAFPDDPDVWDDPPLPPPSPRCRCSHPRSLHYRDRKDRPTCGIAVCGCIEFRPKENDQ